LGYSADGDSRERLWWSFYSLKPSLGSLEKNQHGFVRRFWKHKSHFKTPSMKEQNWEQDSLK
jgi:hypothetical protein